MRIDAHLHVYPPEYVDVLRALPGGLPPMPIPTSHDADGHMERFGIDAAVVSLGPPGVFFGDQGQANELARFANEWMTSLDRTRLALLGVLPLPDVDASLVELAYALDVLELDGVWLPTNSAGTYLGEPGLDPLLAELDRREAYTFIHPMPPALKMPLDWPVWLVELPFDTTRAFVQLLFSGALDRYQRIRFQLAHLGGTVPFLADRIAGAVLRVPSLGDALAEEPERYLSRLWFDTGLSNAAPALASIRAVVPLERIVFGTDWPYAALPDGPDPAPALASLGAERALVDAANIAALVPRFGKETS